ncbi:uncharacterized protein LOC116435670 [Corvus moneduloides]|uniref:uncharacterized protein LOC116435670 n=1 Tax=Corvus moneduloides TaxID=1196302 RepID=UPI001362BC7D|nr:uncharacterized protein LOC116435670 [Corvus moneduloides]
MGKGLSKEEQATFRVLQRIVSEREIKYDPEVLKGLLRWGQERGFFATLWSVVNTLEWERLGIALWDGLKETKGLSTVWKLIITVLRQIEAEKTAAAGAAARLEPGGPATAFPTFAQEFFGGVDPVIPSLPPAPAGTELQAPQPAPEPEKIEVNELPSPQPPGLPTGCPVASPEELTIALGEHGYPPRPPSPPVRMQMTGIQRQSICAALKRKSTGGRRKKEREKKKPLLMAEGRKNPESTAKSVYGGAELSDRAGPARRGGVAPVGSVRPVTPAEETEKGGKPREREGEEGKFQPGQKLERSRGMRRTTDPPAQRPERKKESPACGSPSRPASDNPARRWQGIIREALVEVGAVERMERSLLKETRSRRLWQLFVQLWQLLNSRKQDYFITHIRSHSGLTEGLALGKEKANQLVAPLWASASPNTDKFGQARRPHEFFSPKHKGFTQTIWNIAAECSRNRLNLSTMAGYDWWIGSWG